MNLKFVIILAVFITSQYVISAPPITALAYNADGTSLAVGSRGKVEVLDTANNEIITTISKLPGRVTSMAWQGNTLAFACGEPGTSPTIQILQMPEGKLLATVAEHKDAVYALALSPDGKFLATGGYDKVIQLWLISNPAQPKLVHTLKDHSDTIYGLSFHPKLPLLASAAADRTVKVWDTLQGRRLYSLSDSTDWLYALSWSPDGTRVAAGGVDKSIRVWKADTNGGELEHSAFAHSKAVTRLAYNAKGDLLYSVGEDKTVKAWATANLRETKTFNVEPTDILAFALNPNAKEYTVGLFDGSAKVWDTATAKLKATPLPAKPKPPTITALSHSGVTRGVPTRVTVTGRGMADVNSASIPGRTAAKLLIVPQSVTATSLQLDISLHGIEEPDFETLQLKAPAGTSAPFPLAIDRYAAIPETGNTESARLAPEIKTPTTIAGTLDRAGDIDYYRFPLQAGEEIAVEAIVKKFKPVLTVNDSQGNTLLETDKNYLGFRAPSTSTYVISIRDREYKGGAGFNYRLSLGEFPVATGVFPLGVTRGTSKMVHLQGVFLPEEVRTQRVMPNPNAKNGDIVSVMTPSGMLGSTAVVVGEYPQVIVDATQGGTLKTIPSTADGILLEPGVGQNVRFMAKKGQTLVVEALARKYGSPVDPVVEILDVAGKPVPRATLRCVAKTAVTFRDHDSVQPNIRLEAWNEFAANDLVFVGTDLMRIRQLPGHPDADCNFWQNEGRRVSFLETTPTHHAQNETIYKVEVHPPGSTFPPNGMPVFQLNYINDDGGTGYGKDARLTFTAPADGTYSARVTDARGHGGKDFAYRLTVRNPMPDFQWVAPTKTPSIWRGGTIPLPISINRKDGFDGPVRVSVEGLPNGITASPATIESGFSTADIGLSAEEGTMLPKAVSAMLVARAELGGKTVERKVKLESITVVEPGDIVVSMKETQLKLKPGGEVRFIVQIQRNNGFKGRIPLDVKGLPHGVTIQNIGLNGVLINENETEREVVLKAEAWVTPKMVPVYPLARREGKNTEHATTVVVRVE